MYTINISLPKLLHQRVDQLIEEEGYASRSEFFRTLIRIYTALRGEKLELLEFVPKSLSEIKNELKKTKKYNEEFINNIITGLKKSSIYENKTFTK
jgi:metal-responsive CopG/Arc/MetJ family transcriptional regulator